MGRSGAAHVKAHSDISVHDTPRIVAFVTLGQSPRIDLIPEILDSGSDQPVQRCRENWISIPNVV